jgi:hypothetical protein
MRQQTGGRVEMAEGCATFYCGLGVWVGALALIWIHDELSKIRKALDKPKEGD